MARCCRGGWFGDECAEAAGLVGPRFGLPVFARNSAWTSMPSEHGQHVWMLGLPDDQVGTFLQ